jgi:hypothetical protein
MRKNLRLATGTALALMLLALALAGAVRLRASDRPQPVPPYTLRATLTQYPKSGGAVTAKYIYRRSANGDWRSIVTRDGRIFNDFSFFAGRGSLTVDYKSKTIWREPEINPNPPGVNVGLNAESLKNEPEYVGTDTILGRTAYHMATKDSAGNPVEEWWYIPELGAVPVKFVTYLSPGRIVETQEPFELVEGEPDPEVMRLPDFPQADRAKGQ